MVGVKACGAYIPKYRLKKSDVTQAWEAGTAKGERSAANWDEDSITMAVAAAVNCLRGIDRSEVDGLIMATTTSPYREKQAATVVAAALDLRRDIIAADITSSVKAGTTALRLASEMVKSRAVKNILVVASDMREGAPGSPFEASLGDGAAALLISDSGFHAALEGTHTHSDEIIDIWRAANDRYINSWEDRFILEEGYARNLKECISEFMRKQGAKAGDLARVVYPGYTPRSHLGIAKGLGFDMKAQVQDPMLDVLGYCGAAHAILMLIAAFEKARLGDRILLADQGDGASVFAFRMTAEIGRSVGRMDVSALIESKDYMPSYAKYLRLRQIVGVEGERRRPTEQSSATVMWRDRDMVLALIGGECKRCGTRQFPPQRVCVKCFAKDEFNKVRFSDKKGLINTFAGDSLTPVPSPPLFRAVVDLDGGGRLDCHMTDCRMDELRMEMPVEMVFRKMHDAMGFPNYFWKATPLREGK